MLLRLLVDELDAEVTEAHALVDGTVCIDLRVPAGRTDDNTVGSPTSA